MRPAIYIRVSSREQVDGYSLDAQERLCREYCAAQGWPDPVVFADAGKSAYLESIRKRPAFARLLHAIEAREFDVLVCHRLDRFARNQETAFREFRRLKEAGATFVSVSDRDYDFTTPLGKLLFGLLTGLAEYFSSNLSTEVIKGQRERRLRGFRHSSLPYGARLVDGVGPAIEVDPAKAAALARILEVAAAMSDPRAALTLTEEGVPTRRGGGWHGFSVREVVRRAGWLAEQLPPWPARYAAAAARTPKPPVRADRATRLLTGYLRCDHCGGRIHYNGVSPSSPVLGVQCDRTPGPKRCLPDAPRKTDARAYEAEVIAWFAALPPSAHVVRAAERLASRDDPALAELATIRERRLRVEEKYDAGLIDRDEMYAQAAALNERERAIAPRAPDIMRFAAELAALRESLPGLPPEAANAMIRPVVAEVRVCGRRCRVVPTEEMARLLDEARRLARGA